MSYYKINNKYFSWNNKLFLTNWKPNILNNMVFWGQVNKKYIIEENNIVYKWKDNSGLMNDAIQKYDFYKPLFIDNYINGYPVLYFDNDYFLKIPLKMNYFTIFTVIKTLNPEIVYEFGNSTINETGFFLTGDRNSIGVSNGGFSNLVSIKNNGDDWLVDNNWKILTHQYNGFHRNHNLFINKNYQSSDTYFNYNDNPGNINKIDELNLGSKYDGSNGTKSYIVEFMVYNDYLNYNNIIKINDYLNNKYKIY